jgi:large conductance mechanosensitive channel
MLQEFKTFAMRGNLVDMAVGFIMGGAFGKMATSFVSDVIMPPIGLLLGGTDFSRLAITLKQAVMEGDKVVQPAVTIQYGTFINTVIDFLIVAWVIFLVIKAINAMKKKEEAAPPAPPAPTKDQTLLMEIRDLLKTGK